MFGWLKNLLNRRDGAPASGEGLWIGLHQPGCSRKGKSPLADLIASIGAKPGEEVALYPDGRTRIIGRAPNLTVAVDNTTSNAPFILMPTRIDQRKRLSSGHQMLETIAAQDGTVAIGTKGNTTNDSSEPQPRRRLTPFLRLDTKRFDSPTNLRLWCWGIVLRLALLAGHPVVLIGACRTGKTLLLSKMTPGKIIDKREDAMRGQRPVITEAEVPAGIYSLDKCQLFKPASVGELVSVMAAKKRTFCLAAQRYCAVKEAIDVYRSTENAKRVFLVVVGGESNPSVILRELPQ